MSLGVLLKSKRTALDMTLDDVSEAAGMSKSHLHALEQDTSEPGIVLCAKLSVALGVSVQAMAAAALSGALKVSSSRGGASSTSLLDRELKEALVEFKLGNQPAKGSRKRHEKAHGGPVQRYQENMWKDV